MAAEPELRKIYIENDFVRCLHRAFIVCVCVCGPCGVTLMRNFMLRFEQKRALNGRWAHCGWWHGFNSEYTFVE